MISTSIVTLFDPNVVAYGKVIRSVGNGFAVSIEAGCNGVEATLVLCAAILAFPAPWRHKALGIAIGVVAVQLLNIVRVISLFYIGQWNFDVVRVGAPVRLAGADHARRADRLADLGAARAARRRADAAAGRAAGAGGRVTVACAALKSPLVRFVLLVLAWLPLAFVAWYVLAPVHPVAGAADPARRSRA